MKEKDIQIIFGKKNKMFGVFELKLCKKISMPFKQVAEHQLKALWQTKHKGLYHKISDNPWMKRGFKTYKKPFDCLNIKSPAYLVICWYIPRKRKTFYYIDIDEFLRHKEGSNRKSLTEEEAKEISTETLEA